MPSVASEETAAAVLSMFAAAGFSRLPIYKDAMHRETLVNLSRSPSAENILQQISSE